MSDGDWTPNLLIPGAAKCGTTTIHDLLVAHPRITGGFEKEVRFLMDAGDDLETPHNVRAKGLSGWRESFPDRGLGDFEVWVDASPQYQFQDIALQVITTLRVKPKVLFMVRAPSRRLFSMYQYARYHQRTIPWIASFAEFVREIRNPTDPRLLRQRMLANAWRDTVYDHSIEHWRAALPQGNVRIVWMEALADDRDRVLSRIAKWLGVDPGPLITAHIAQSNPTVVTRSLLVRRLGKNAAAILPENFLTRRLKDAVKKLNSAPIDSNEAASNADLLRDLEKEFAPAMHRTEALRQELEQECSESE